MSKFSIHIEPTSNKEILKFVANSFLTQAQSFEFNNIDEAGQSPIAQQLFYLPFVKTVFISQNFIAIEKYNIVEWEDVKQEVADAIIINLNKGMAVITKNDEVKKIPITVYAETTPNPTVMRFVTNRTIAIGTFEFKDIDQATNAPLAMALFNFPFVKEVFISDNYVSVMKYNLADWNDITLEVREFIRTYIESGKQILKDEILQKNTKSTSLNAKDENEYTDIEQEIIKILDEYVKPAVASDGGHIAFDSFNEDTKTVKVILQGACSGCPSSTVTLKNGIETMLQDMLQGRVSFVEAVNG